ncbi:MAG: hypothetical protein WBH08_10760 [Methanothrix sp.]
MLRFAPVRFVKPKVDLNSLERDKSTPAHRASEISAPDRSASVMVALIRFAPTRLAPVRFTPFNWEFLKVDRSMNAFMKLAPDRFASLTFAAHKLAPSSLASTRVELSIIA